MTKIYFPKLKNAIQNTGSSLLISSVLLAGLTAGNAFSQVSYSFTPCSASGSVGPTQAMVNTGYASTNLNGSVTVSGVGMQVFTVPLTGAYRIETRGAQGGTSSGVNPGANGGLGAIMKGDFNLTAGQTLSIVVGQSGSGSNYGGSGGGGSYVVTTGNVPLCIAGGGGGAIGYPGYANGYFDGGPGLTSTAGGSANVVGGPTYGVQAAGSGGGAPGYGGTNGYGGGSGVASAGGGLIGDGANGGTPTNPTYSGGGKSFLNGSSGGIGAQAAVNSGGFGGGGGTQAASGYGAGGGGYSGGGGGSLLFTPTTASGNGGGGGSYNAGTNQNNTSGVNSGNGFVIITSLCNVNATASSSVICSGNSTTLTTNASGSYSWSTGNTTSSVIVVSPTTTTTYSVSGTGTSPSGCAGNAVVTITVSPGTPTLAITSSTPSTCFGNTVSVSATGALTYTFSNSISNGVAFLPATGVNVYTVTGGNGCGISTGNITVTVTALPVTTAATSTLICAGTPATLTAGGATSYTWMPGSSTLGAIIVSPSATTIYTLTGKTGSCSGLANITITTKPNPTLSISPSASAICNGDVINLNVTGNAVTYTWSPGGPGTSISAFPANTTLYSVTGTNSVNCVATAQQVIVVNPLPVVNATVSNPLVCSGGASTLAASGASTYVWTGGSGANSATMVVNPTADATYTVTGTSSLNCSSSTVAIVSVYSPTITVTSGTTICVGATAVLGAGVADTYSWSNGQSNQNTSVNPTITTVYTLTALVNNLNGLSCPASNTVEVTVNPNPTVTATSSRTEICVGESTTLTATGAGATGTYTFSGGAGSVVSATSVVSPIANQTYSIAGIDANGCKGKSTYNLLVSQCTGISVNSANSAKLSIYPNPSTGEFTISGNQAITLQITNELGQHIRTVVLDKNTMDIKVNNLPNGIYFISGKNESGSVKQKIVIAK